MADSGYSEATDAQGTPAQLKDIATARKRLNIAIEATNQNRIYQVQDLRFLAGSPDNKFQWPEAVVALRENDPNGPRPCLTINKLPQHVLQVTNEQRQNRPSIKIIPVDNKGDVEVAEVLTGIVRHIEYASDADAAYSTGGDSQVAIGEGYVRVLSDYTDTRSFEQDLQILGVKNAFSVYMDPIGLQKDPTGAACEWCFIVEDLSEDEFERQYPEADPINWDLAGTGDEWKAWFPDSNTVRIAEYYCFRYEERTLQLWADGATTLEGDEQEAMRVTVGLAPIKTRKTTVRQLMWQKMNGCEIIDERELPGKYLPVVRMVGNEWYIDGRMVCAGLVRNAKDAQRMFNYWKSTETETLALAPKAPFVGPAEAFEGHEDQWQQANTKNFAYLKYNGFNEAGERIDKPERQQPPMPPVGIVNAALGAADDIKSATGQYDPSLGNNPQAKSGVALQREQRKTDVGVFHYIDNQARAVRQVGRIIVDLIPKYYDTRRIARIIGEQQETDHVMIDPSMPQAIQKTKDETGIEQIAINPSIGKYDVIVSVGPSFTSKRQEAAQMMGEVLQGNPQLMGVIGDLYFKMLDVPGAEEIAKRLKKTLPPGLAEEEDGKEPEPMVATPQGPIPASAAGQLIAQQNEQLAQAAEQLKKAGDIEQAEAALKDQAHSIELAKKDVEALLKDLDCAKQELAHREQMAKEKIDNGERVVASIEGGRQDSAALAQNMQTLAEGLASAFNTLQEAIAAQGQMIEQVGQIAAAPRRNTMTVDGETFTSTSEIVRH